MSFTNVDQAECQSYFVEYLTQANASPSFQAYKQRSYQSLGDIVGKHVLEVGCGVGYDVFNLARIVGPEGHVTGVDLSETLLSKAREQAATGSLPCSFEQASIESLPFEDHTFDACRIDRVLIHVPDPAQALEEVLRVLRPGGVLVVLEGDFDSLAIAHPDQELTQTMTSLWSSLYLHGHIGKELSSLVQRAGFAEVVSEEYKLEFLNPDFAESFLGFRDGVQAAISTGAVHPLKAALWWADIRKLSREGQFAAALTGYGVRGVKQ
ncbi:MAG: methyltransferase domain-containing protein [Deltaproteobacteria bacterium]|nr:MAG: methyltransferase domain-containing protein [Deltaproteobacteria bacterium]